MYFVELSKSAKKFLKKLSPRDYDLILNKIYSIRNNPFRYLKKLQGDKFWSLRIMKYRLIIEVVIVGRKIIVLRIGYRKNVYSLN